MKRGFYGKHIVLRSGGNVRRKKQATERAFPTDIDMHANIGTVRSKFVQKLIEKRTAINHVKENNVQSAKRDNIKNENTYDNEGSTQIFKGMPAAPAISANTLNARGGRQESMFKRREKPRSLIVGVLLTTLSLLLVLLICIGFGGLGIVLGIAGAYVETTPELDIGLIEDLDQTSLIYDSKGKLITSYTSTENREWASYDEIPEMLRNAFISIEDSRFYQHSGVDFKRLFKVVFDTLRNVNSGGGSTITQQLIKLRVIGNEQSYKRKIQEAYLAIELEKQYEKEQILEAYLNAIHLGDSNYGVKAAAEDYFGKELSELTIRECAMLAGINQRPSAYNPRKNMYIKKDMSLTNKRTDTVLSNMYALGYISREEYDAALKEDVSIVEKSKIRQMYDMPYFVEYAMSNVITCMLEDRSLQDNKTNRAAIEKELRTSGYKIYLTIDPAIQLTLEDAIYTWDDYPLLRDPSKAIKIETLSDGSLLEIPEPQAAAVIIDHETFEVRALVGGRHQPTQRKQLNRAYQSSMPVGSSIKPLSVYAPALDLGAHPSDIELNFAQSIEGYGNTEERGYPLGGLTTQGPVTMRYGIRQSLNVVAARVLLESVGLENSKQYLIDLGIEPSGISATGAGLALGTSSISPLEMAVAYATLANGGVYMEPVAFTKVVDSKGNVVLDSSTIRKQRRVFKESTAWLITSMLTDAVNSGTGTNARIKGMTVAGKTGTNEQYTSVYFAGFTPYYASALWIGHDDYKIKLKSGTTGGSDAAPLWRKFMASIHEGLEDKDIQDKDAASLGMVKRSICSVSGLVATDACTLDEKHQPVSDWFLVADVPNKKCNMHIALTRCPVSGKIANEYCPTPQAGVALIIPPGSKLSTIKADLLSKWMPEAIVGVTSEQLKSMTLGSALYNQYFCTLHTSMGALMYDNYDSNRAQEASDIAQQYLNGDYGLTPRETQDLFNYRVALQNAIAAGDAPAVELAVNQIMQIIGRIDERNASPGYYGEQTLD